MALARIKRDDLVEVLSGREKGKRGKVREVLLKDSRAIVAEATRAVEGDSATSVAS